MYLEIILLYLSKGTKKNHGETQSGYSVSQPTFEPSISRMQTKALLLEPSSSLSWVFYPGHAYNVPLIGRHLRGGHI
jgi:hypothetical protein